MWSKIANSYHNNPNSLSLPSGDMYDTMCSHDYVNFEWQFKECQEIICMQIAGDVVSE